MPTGQKRAIPPSEILPNGRLTAKGLCAKYGIAGSTLKLWIGKGLPVAVKGGSGRGARSEYDPTACDEWVRQHGASLQSQGADLENPRTKAEADLALTLQKIRAARARADRDDLNLRVRRGELLEAAEVERGRVDRILVLKSGLLNLRDRVAPAAAHRDETEVAAIVEREVLGLLGQFSGAKTETTA